MSCPFRLSASTCRARRSKRWVKAGKGFGLPGVVRSGHCVTAADRHKLAGDLSGRQRRREPEDGAADVLSGRHPSQRSVFHHEIDLFWIKNFVLPCRPQAGCADRFGSIWYDQAWAHDVGPNAVPTVLARSRAGKGHHCCLRRTVDTLADLTEGRVTGNEHDRAATGFLHRRDCCLGGGDGREQIYLDRPLPFVAVGVGRDKPRNAPTSVVNQNVDAAPPLLRTS